MIFKPPLEMTVGRFDVTVLVRAGDVDGGRLHLVGVVTG
jgi:hypothetical protein